ncbi:MAG TPA: indole-3-glycerol phosphate synthase TrpC [Vicinamibacteria bacterium]|nr:indole-3-glycerol phosphate synthase TrpC [Vicinamibacteria bacterium]
MSAPVGVIGEIVARTRARVHELRRSLPLDRILALAPTPGARRSFSRALLREGRVNIIAEYKRRSPSRGVIRADLHPVRAAQAYESAGAAALSVLTEPEYFGGRVDDLQEARSATLLPTLRKDFIVDPYQVWESWIAGSDALLLIVAALSDAELLMLLKTAAEASIEALVEVHDEEELRRAVGGGAQILGVNNRDLRSFEVSLDTSLRLAPDIPDHVVAVAESGLGSGADVRRLRDAGYDAFLIGEHLLRAPEPGAALEALLVEAGDPGPGGLAR